jgi:hypothetical protein
MNYQSELEQALKAKKKKYEDISFLIEVNVTKCPNFMENVTLRNSLSVDIETIKQRIFYAGKDAYMPDISISINQSNI